MQTSINVGVALFLVLFTALPAAAKSRVAVSKFSDKTDNSSRCKVSWFGSNLGSGMSDQLITALQETGRFDIQERENLQRMYGEEHQLINAKRSAAPAKNQFRAAHYSIVGAVTSFELCENGGGADLDVGGLLGFTKSNLKVGGKSQSSKVVIDIRAVDVATGQVVAGFSSEGSVSSAKLDVRGDIRRAGFGTDAFFNSPLGEATRDAIDKAARRLASELPEKREVAAAQVTTAPATTASVPARVPAQAAPAAAARPAVAQETLVGAMTVCPWNEHDNGYLSMCRTLEYSASGERAKILDLASGKERLIASQTVRRISRATQAPRLGDSMLLKCDTQGLYCRQTSAKVLFHCRAVDAIGAQAVVNCGGKDLTVPLTSLYRLEGSVRAPAAATGKP